LSAKLGGVEVAQIFVKQRNGGFYSILYGSPRKIIIPQYEGTPYLLSHVHPSGNPSPSDADKELLESIRSIQAANGQPQQTSSTIIPQGAANTKFDLTTPTVDYNPMLLPNVNLKK
jgi:hypothetical protein